MRKVMLAIAILLLAMPNAQAQVKWASQKIAENQVPDAVKTAYQNSYGFPVEFWEKREASVKNKSEVRYVAVFSSLDPTSGKMTNTRARYKDDGTALSSIKFFKAEDLPAEVTAAAKKAYPDLNIIRAEQHFLTKNPAPVWRVILRKGKAQKAIFLCDNQGKPIDKMKMPSEGLDDNSDND